jgi:hypothetical protein
LTPGSAAGSSLVLKDTLFRFLPPGPSVGAIRADDSISWRELMDFSLPPDFEKIAKKGKKLFF